MSTRIPQKEYYPAMEERGAFKNILFPTDFSEIAHHAFEYALSFAEQLGARIILLHVYQHAAGEAAYLPKDFVESLQEEKLEEAMDYFHEYQRNALLQTGKEVEVRPILEAGKATNEIIRLSREMDIDLILMGTQGAASTAEKILGSVTTRVIEKAACPVLAIPAEASYQPIEQIMYAMSMEDADFQIIDSLVELAAQLKARLACTHIRTEESYWTQIALSKFEDLYKLEEKDKITFFISHHEDITRGLQAFTTEHKVDMVAMLTHKRDMITNLFDRSLTKEMVLYTDVPLLAFHT